MGETNFKDMTPAELLQEIEIKKNSFEFKLVEIEDEIDDQLETETNAYRYIELTAKKELIRKIRKLYRDFEK